MKTMCVGLATAAAGMLMIFSSVSAAPPGGAKKKSDYTMPTLTVPHDNALTPARIDLGQKLFFDPRLSGSQWISCASCHNPGLGWSDGLSTAIGDGMKTLPRATPTIVNAAFNKIQMWDGRARTLEEQALGPIVAGGAAVGRSQFMPPWGNELTEEQISDVVYYLNVIAAKPANTLLD